MIIELTNPLLIPQVLELAKSIPGIPVDKLRGLLERSFSQKNGKVYAYVKNDVLLGYVCATTEFFNGQEVVFIQSTVVKPNEDNIANELFSKLKEWAKLKKLEYMYMITNRDERFFSRKYNFEPMGIVMRRSING